MKTGVRALMISSMARMWRTRGDFIHDLSTTIRKKSPNFVDESTGKAILTKIMENSAAI
jgi:hypothetical protein